MHHQQSNKEKLNMPTPSSGASTPSARQRQIPRVSQPDSDEGEDEEIIDVSGPLEEPRSNQKAATRSTGLQDNNLSLVIETAFHYVTTMLKEMASEQEKCEAPASSAASAVPREPQQSLATKESEQWGWDSVLSPQDASRASITVGTPSGTDAEGHKRGHRDGETVLDVLSTIVTAANHVSREECEAFLGIQRTPEWEQKKTKGAKQHRGESYPIHSMHLLLVILSLIVTDKRPNSVALLVENLVKDLMKDADSHVEVIKDAIQDTIGAAK